MIAPTDILKQLFKMPYSGAQLSIAVHRVGQTLILNTGYILYSFFNFLNVGCLVNCSVIFAMKTGLMLKKVKSWLEDATIKLNVPINLYF